MGLFYDSVTAACMQDPAFCMEVVAGVVRNAGAASGNPCTQEAADAVAGALETAGAIAAVATVAGVVRRAAARRGAKYVDELVSGAYGQSSAGAGQVLRTLQTGSNKMLKQTANALNDSLGKSVGRRDWGRALESLKRDLGLPGDHHGRILSNGDYVDESGNVLGTLTDYLP
jgi:hypothetical protein